MAAPLPSNSAAYALVEQYLGLAASNQLQAAYRLWASSWQEGHPYAAWAADHPIPPGAQYQVGAPTHQVGYGTWGVPFRIGVSTPAGVRWADGIITVGGTAGRPALEAGGLAAPAPPVNLQALTTTAADGTESGQADCGGYQVVWSARPGAAPGDGWASHISVTAPDGRPVPMPALAPFSFGSLPTSCGDLFGDGGEELVVTTATTTAGFYRQAAVYRFNGSAAPTPLGGMSSVGSPTEPRPASPDGLYPYLIVTSAEIDVVGATPILAPVYWAFDGTLFRNATADLPEILTADFNARLAALTAGPTCGALPTCAAPTLLRAYYDEAVLGKAAGALARLQALLPSGDRAWLAQQAQVVNYVIHSA